MPTGSRIVLRTAAEADIPTPDTDQVAFFADSDDADAPAWKDDGGTVHSLTGAPGAAAPALTYLDHGNTGSTETVDASVADVQRLVANAATVTLTITGAPSAGTPGVIRLWLEQDGSGGRDWAFPGSVDFGDPGEPDWTTRSGGAVDLVDLVTVDAGTTWVAVLAGQPGPQGDPGADGAMGTGTSNPGGPSTNDMFFRTDLGLIIYYDGTRWLTTQIFELTATQINVPPWDGSIGIGTYPLGLPSGQTYWFVECVGNVQIGATNTGAAYHVINWIIRKGDYSGAVTIATFNTSADTHDTNVTHRVAVGAEYDPATYTQGYVTTGTKVGSPSTLGSSGFVVRYRIVVT